ncbi:GCN5 family acetyltransferase [Chlorella sorokiniana]|uniref:GCN5 family acetyltransferase n=1 Tax=Chlorella sorokiniana TaxID=3076 RepID=A0A2P6TGU9_CHLSO|nr:GCN5 family acetyltransferase [Chlorella sorokiniana]|eukprot:PRW33510.1 GCN5 family acetyltransferase [Chlorella sorokiniana]
MPQSVRARTRAYDPAADHPAVVDMCADVYGGTDPLPKYLAAQLAEPGTRVWVAQREGSSAPESLICCQPRGDALWVWGARTLAAARGCGLGALLLAHTEAHARQEHASLRWLLSTTILANTAMLRLFERQGWHTLCEVDIFPRLEIVQAATRLLEQQQEGQPALLAALLPAAAADLQAVAAAAADLHPRWKACTSASDLAEVHAVLRQQRAAAAGCPASSAALSWAPVDFKLLPLDGEDVESAAAEGNVWVLPSPTPGDAAAAAAHSAHTVQGGHSSSSGGETPSAHPQVDTAFMVLRRSKWLSASDRQHEVWLAAVAAGSEAALASAILQALKLHPRCLEFFIDRCDRFAAPAFVQEAAGKPDTLAGWGTPASYMVWAKRLPPAVRTAEGAEGAAAPVSPRSRV